MTTRVLPSGDLVTPDGRYFVVRGRLWRLSDPGLDAGKRDALVRDLMQARRSLRTVAVGPDRSAVRQRIDALKTALGERGPVWWRDGAPDYNRRMVRNTPYAAWHAAASAEPATAVQVR